MREDGEIRGRGKTCDKNTKSVAEKNSKVNIFFELKSSKLEIMCLCECVWAQQLS